MPMPAPYQKCKEIADTLADKSLKGDARKFRIMELCREAADLLDDYHGGDKSVVRDVTLARIGKAQAAVGLQ